MSKKIKFKDKKNVQDIEENLKNDFNLLTEKDIKIVLKNIQKEMEMNQLQKYQNTLKERISTI